MSPAEILKKYWGYSSFLNLQEEIIFSIMNEKHTLALLPTGGGKSVCFQIPAMMMEGICLVISPLIALMRDQVEQLNRRGIKATSLFSEMTPREMDITLDNCIYGEIKFLYLAPERLNTELFLARAKRMNISLLVVDEAHCISQWGYDFRPSYLQIAEFRNALNIEKVAALTATATKTVEKDILSKLEMDEAHVFCGSFARANLSYSVFRLENKEQKLREILENVSGSCVVYVRTRRQTKKLAEVLRRNQVSADYYHAGLLGKERSAKQDAWTKNQFRVMVATNAFGMGIDKPDVRIVVHLDLPDSLEAYYQESGRAGRDRRKAYAVMIYTQQDIDDLRERTEKNAVDITQISHTYQALCNYFKLAIGSHPQTAFPFHFEQFINIYNLPVIQAYASLKKLAEEGLIQLNESFFVGSRVMFLLDNTQTYTYRVANPKLDPLIKALLRLYGGTLFNSYIKIKEKDLALLLKTDESQVRKWLDFLSNRKVIDYQAQIDSPTLTFLMPREDSKKLAIDTKRIEKRRKQIKKNIEDVIDYVSESGCRMRLFQNYFGEETDSSCGICDNDVEKKKRRNAIDLSLKKVEQVLDVARNMTDLRALLSDHLEEQIIEAVRLLIEEGKVIEKEGMFIRVQNASLS